MIKAISNKGYGLYFLCAPAWIGTRDFIQPAGVRDSAKKIGHPVKEIISVAEELQKGKEIITA
jgi:hypothetical protein